MAMGDIRCGSRFFSVDDNPLELGYFEERKPQMPLYKKATTEDERFINHPAIKLVVIERGLGKIPPDSVQGRVLERQKQEEEQKS